MRLRKKPYPFDTLPLFLLHFQYRTLGWKRTALGRIHILVIPRPILSTTHQTGLRTAASKEPPPGSAREARLNPKCQQQDNTRGDVLCTYGSGLSMVGDEAFTSAWLRRVVSKIRVEKRMLPMQVRNSFAVACELQT